MVDRKGAMQREGHVDREGDCMDADYATACHVRRPSRVSVIDNKYDHAFTGRKDGDYDVMKRGMSSHDVIGNDYDHAMASGEKSEILKSGEDAGCSLRLDEQELDREEGRRRFSHPFVGQSRLTSTSLRMESHV